MIFREGDLNEPGIDFEGGGLCGGGGGDGGL
jgi:hypothetical protein